VIIVVPLDLVAGSTKLNQMQLYSRVSEQSQINAILHGPWLSESEIQGNEQ